MHFGILKKFICAFLLVALLPLVGLSLFTWLHINRAGADILESSQASLKHYSIALLKNRTKNIAVQVEELLETTVSDLGLLSIMPPTPEAFIRFVSTRTRSVWLPGQTDSQPAHQSIPLYYEAALIDSTGMERILVREGRDMPTCNISAGITGAYGPEHYFEKVRDLAPGELYVSHLVGWHVDRENAEAGPGSFRGYYRFARPLFHDGVFAGAITLALDQRHLMELTQHVLPFGLEGVVSPDYYSGDYAFLFDDQGWAITHPKAWDIRGADRRTGRLVNPQSEDYTQTALKAGTVPFNLLHVPFIHTSYQTIARGALAGESGIARARNVSKIPRILAYAPIRFSHGTYAQSGVFGGVTLGAQINLFQNIVSETSDDIDAMLTKTLRNLAFFILISGIAVTLVAIWLARGFTRPILAIKDGVDEIGRGNYLVDLSVTSRDELSLLAEDVRQLGIQLKTHVEDLDAYYLERNRMVEEALKRRKLIESIFRNMLSGLMVFDHQGIILSANPRASKFFKCNEADLIGRHVEEIFGPFPKMLGLLTGDQDQPDPILSSINMKLPDGRTVYFETTRARLVPETNPDERRVLFIFREVTKRKAMEAQLNRSNRLISMGILAAGIAHEIRNPLTGISLLLDDLHDRMATRTEERLMMESALNEIEKLDGIISELLAFASNKETNPKAGDVNQVVAQTLFFIQKQFKKTHITLVKELDKNLPRVMVDTEKMKQALLNILLNALGVLTDREAGKVVIATTFIPISLILDGKPAVRLTVRDNGPGIAKEDLEFIFDPFYTKKAGGFGLGLSITHTIVEEHGGKILAETETEGEGACFTIYLPAILEQTDSKEGA